MPHTKTCCSSSQTQSHLIEILGHTKDKAQHFELTIVGNGRTDIETLLLKGSWELSWAQNPVKPAAFKLRFFACSLVGMWLVLEGDLTLGMLIAFRIISGNVTGPLLQLSSLYQGFQGVQVSMERLSDILDQNAELNREDDVNQIAMPPIQGNIRFEDVNFRFGDKGQIVNRVFGYIWR